MKRLLRDLHNARGNCLRIQVLFFHAENIGEAAHRQSGQILRQGILMRNGADGVHIAAEQALVDFHGHIPRLGGIHRDEHVHLAAADMPLDRRLDGVLGKEEAARHAHRSIQIAVVDALQLHADGQALDSSLGAAVAGHAFDHTSSRFSLNETISKVMLFGFFFSRWLKTVIAAPSSTPEKQATMQSPSEAPAA